MYPMKGHSGVTIKKTGLSEAESFIENSNGYWSILISTPECRDWY